MLTRIAYQVLGMIDYLPLALEEDVNIKFHHKPSRHKVKTEKAVEKRKREFGESAVDSQAKKMRGQLLESEKEEDKK